ncbi:hypothetical protein [Luteolibacter luteus]|uniref:LamG domain-containing protein n=1 Tax=Luteolibacter luteus TaxID=2728835 RepID=A0A858RDG8_9BACT|nr:hypothetical protein [Luteolibacter luteus]QJE94360.1 LamG domain-containing protein [Luteolibacter luteus]
MNIRSFAAFVSVSLCLMSVLLGGTFERNKTKGVWEFNGSLASLYPNSAAPLMSSFAIGAAPQARYLTEGGNQFLVVNSGTSAFGGLKPGETLLMPIGSGGNGFPGAAYANEWTIVMDVRFTTFTGYTALIQDGEQNTDDAEIFINPSGQIQLYGANGPSGANPVASDPLALNTWYRLAFISTFNAVQNKQILRVQINGTTTSQSAAGTFTAPPDGRYSLGNRVALFSDENNETNVIHVGSVAAWRTFLVPSDVVAIGSYQAGGISWPNMVPAGGTPPLPPLSGRIVFADFAGIYTPPTGQALLDLAAQAVGSTTPGALCDVVLPLGATGGRVTGFPNHSFGGSLVVSVMPNGDVISHDGTPLVYGGAGADIGTASNVTFVRGDLFLDVTQGLTAYRMELFFPAGMNVTLAEDDMRGHGQVRIASAVLNQSLVPKTTVPISRELFDSTSGTMWACTERVPVRFPTTSISWNPANGIFSFGASGFTTPHREKQKLKMRDLLDAGATVKNAVPPASNDFYFLGGLITNDTVRFGTRAGGVSTVQVVDLTLTQPPAGVHIGETSTHFPKAVIRWTGNGRITYSQNQVDPSFSFLPSNAESSAGYARSVTTADCKGEAAAAGPAQGHMIFQPVGNQWTFTTDGGLKGNCGIMENGSTAFVPKWGGYKDGATDLFAHQFTTVVQDGRFLAAGNAVIGTEVAAIGEGQRAAAMLYTGHGFPSNEDAIERPGSGDYLNFGEADYPGINIRNVSGTASARSRLAGSLTPAYPLAENAKYYVRSGGVSGRHLTSSGTPISLSAYGSDFTLSALNLAFLDGKNVNSGVTGNVVVKTPLSTSFALNFNKLLFGPQGQLQEAKLASGQGAKTLGYWNFSFTPNAIDFPQPKTCPPPLPSTGFVRIGATATLPAMTTTPVTGTLGFYNSDLVTEASPVAAGHPKISRFEPGGLLTVPGPNGKVWNVNCTSGIYLNQYASSEADAGTLNAGGLMDVPFFNDIPVHLRTPSAGNANAPLIYVRNALATTGSYDPSHRARPPGVVSTENFLTGEPYHPVAYRKWQDMITFQIPVAMAPGAATFRSPKLVKQDVFLFNLSEGIPKMTPDHSELVFDGQATLDPGSLLKQVNVASLLTGSSLGGTVQAQIDGAMSAVNGLDKVLADNIQELVKPALSTAATQRANAAFFNNLKNSATRATVINDLAAGLLADVTSIFSPGTSGLGGQARREMESKIQSVESGLATASQLVGTAQKFTDLANAIGSAISNSGAPAIPDTDRLAELKAIFDRVASDLASARLGIGAPLNAAMNQGGSGIGPAINAALTDLQAKWAPAGAAQASALYANATATEFANDLSKALADRLVGTVFAGVAQQISREYLADVRVLARQALDDTLATATNLLPNPAAAVGDYLDSRGLGGELAAARLRGYARFQGDSLDEMRLDGSVRMRMVDDMKFDGYFLFKNVDSSTPGGACLLDAGVEAEVSMGASTTLNWPGQAPLDISVGGKVGLNNSGLPIGLSGDLKLDGQLDFSEVRLQQIGLGFGVGGGNCYMYGKGAGKVAAMDVAAGVFVGKTCELAPIQNADPDIGKVVAARNLVPPYTGASIYAYGGISLMPIIGIPPSCLLDLRVGGGQGFFGFLSSGEFTAGFKTTQSVSGEILCIASVKGQQDTVIAGSGAVAGGSPQFNGLSGSSRFTVSGKVGIGWFSYDFDKSVGLLINANPDVSWKIDY